MRLVSPILMTLILSGILALPGVAPAPAHAAQPPQTHAMPCPSGKQPDSVAMTWTSDSFHTSSSGKSVPVHKKGHASVRNVDKVRHVYNDICTLLLVKYAHPIAVACPRATTSAVYHLVFYRRSVVLLRVGEKSVGCRSLWVDGRTNLGSAMLSTGLLLP